MIRTLTYKTYWTGDLDGDLDDAIAQLCEIRDRAVADGYTKLMLSSVIDERNWAAGFEISGWQKKK